MNYEYNNIILYTGQVFVRHYLHYYYYYFIFTTKLDFRFGDSLQRYRRHEF